MGSTYSQGTNGLVRPAQRIFTDPSAATLFDTGTYSYDAAGNITEIGADNYTYDGASRLRESTVKSAGPNRFANYTYDTADNMTSVTSDLLGPRTYNVDLTTNRLKGVGADVNDWTYGTAGNVKTAVGGVFQMDWDAINMQTRFTSPEGEWISVYGPGDYRAWVEDTSTGVKHWTSRGPAGEILSKYEIRGSGTAWTHIRDYLHGAEGLVATRNRNGASRFFHADHLGTPRLLITPAGGQLSQHHYYPFGLEAKTAPAGQIFADGFESGDITAWREDKDELSFKYTGHQREIHEDADYMKGRHYLTVVHRFASVDPVRVGWNLYSYVSGDPMSGTDPTGFILSFENREAKRVFNKYAESLEEGSVDSENIQTLEQSEVSYRIRINKGGSGNEGSLTFDGSHVLINVNPTSPNQETSINSRLAHEIQHGVQFEEGEVGFHNLGTRWRAVYADIYDEVGAFNAQIRQATPRDLQSDLLRGYINAGNKAQYLIRRPGCGTHRDDGIRQRPNLVPGFAPGDWFRTSNFFYRFPKQ